MAANHKKSEAIPRDLETMLQDAVADEHQNSGFKFRLLAMLYPFVQKVGNSAPVAVTLVIFSLLQFLSLIIAPVSDQHTFYEKIRLLRLFPMVHDTSVSILYFAVLYLTATLVLAYFAVTIVAHFSPEGQAAHLVSGLTPHVHWVALVPVTETLLSIWDCPGITAIGTCWAGTHTVHLWIIGAVTLVWTVLVFMLTIASAVTRPFHNDPLAHYPWYFEILYTVSRILLVIRILPSFESVRSGAADIIIDVIVAAYMVSLMWTTFPYYRPAVSWTFSASSLGVSAILLYHAGCSVAYLVTSPAVRPSETGIMCFLAVLAFAVIFPLRSSRTRRLLARPVSASESAEELDLRIHLLIMGTAMRVHRTDLPGWFVRAQLELVSVGHTPEGGADSASRNKDESHTTKEGEEKRNLNATVKRLVEGGRKRRSNADPGFVVQSAWTYLYLFRNVYLATRRIVEAEEECPGLLLQLSIYCLKLHLQHQIEKDNEMREKKGCGNFYRVLEYELGYKRFCELLEKSASARLSFWRNLMEQPDLNVLYALGLGMIEHGQALAAEWDGLSRIYPDHYQSLSVYSKYLHSILGQIGESEILQARLERAEAKQVRNEVSYRRAFSTDSANFIVRYLGKNTAKILRASINAKALFGYSQHTLAGKDLSVLMPKIIGSRHSMFMKENLLGRRRTSSPVHDTVEKNEEEKERFSYPTFCLHREGYIFPVRMSCQKIYSPRFGLLYAGNVQRDPATEGCTYIITNEKGRIAGISKELGEGLNITPMMIAEEEITVQQYCAELENVDLYSLEDTRRLCFSTAQKSAGELAAEVDKAASLQNLLKMEKVQSDVCVRGEAGTSIVAKCVISTMSYPTAGFTLKVFKFPLLGQYDIRSSAVNDNFAKKSSMISYEMLKPGPAEPNEWAGKQNAVGTAAMFLVKSIANVSTFYKPQQSAAPALAPVPVTGTESEAYATTHGGMLAGPTRASSNRLALVTKAAEQLTPATEADSTNSSRLKQKVGFLRKQRYEEFYPTSVRRLKYAIAIFSLLIVCCFCARLYVAFVLNDRFKTFSPLMLTSAKRVASAGRIVESVRELTLYYSYVTNTSKPLMDDAAHYSFFNFASLLPAAHAKNVGSYKDYLMQQILTEVDNLIWEMNYIQDLLVDFSSENVALVEPTLLALTYLASSNSSSKTVKYYESMYSAYYTVASEALTYVAAINQSDSSGLYSIRNTTSYYLITNLLGVLIETSKYARDGIVAEYNTVDNTLDNATNSLLIAVIVILGVFMMVMIPFLLLVHREQSTMLVLLTKIPKADLKDQIGNTVEFLRYYSEVVSRTNVDTADDVESQTQEENESLNGGEAADGEGKIDVQQEQEQHDKATTHSKQSKYIPRKHKAWRIFVVFVLLSGGILMIYWWYNYTASHLASTIMLQLNEMYVLTRGMYFVRYHVTNFYHYFYTNRTGLCSSQPCVTYMSVRIAGRLDELTSLLVSHIANKGKLTTTYNQLFSDLVEGNPCTSSSTDYFRSISGCSTLLGGIFAKGAHAAGIDFLVREKAMKSDFEAVPRSSSEISAFINDPRIMELEILGETFLLPAYRILCEQIVADAKTSTGDNSTQALAYFLAMILFMLVVGAAGGGWILRHLRLSIYDTKSMLSNLPADLILNNTSISHFLLENA